MLRGKLSTAVQVHFLRRNMANPEWDIESNYRTWEIHEDERISGINSIVEEESLQVEMQTTDGINLLGMQQKEEPGKPDNIMNENITSGKDIQGKRNSGSASTLMEESHLVKRQTLYNSSEKEDKSSRQVGQSSDKDSTFM